MKIQLSLDELRAVAQYAAACAHPALIIFEKERLGDTRPRVAINVAQAFAAGADRTKLLRDNAWSALRAAGEARDAGQVAASEAARAAVAAASAAYLHPLDQASQIKHILGAAAHAIRAFELSAGEAVGASHMATAQTLAAPIVVDVLRRYPGAPSGGGRVGEIVRQLDTSLR